MMISGMNYFKLNVQAKDYTINNAYFYITLTSNGDANITEKWSVTYTGDYSRFYKDIHNKGLNAIEKFDKILLHSVAINGNNCMQATDANQRKDYTYSLEGYMDNARMSWYYNAKNETVEYTINYTLKNVVKATDNQLAVFSCRLIGVEFEKEINNISIMIIPPGSTDIQLKNITKEKNGYLTYRTEHYL